MLFFVHIYHRDQSLLSLQGFGEGVCGGGQKYFSKKSFFSCDPSMWFNNFGHGV